MRNAQNRMSVHGKAGAASVASANRDRTIAVSRGGSMHFAPDVSLRRRLAICEASGDKEQCMRLLDTASAEALDGLGEPDRSRSAAAALRLAEGSL